MSQNSKPAGYDWKYVYDEHRKRIESGEMPVVYRIKGGKYSVGDEIEVENEPEQ